jgi:lipopolysaccharide export system permease protein
MPIKIYKYILSKFLTLFLASLAVFTLLFLMDQASRQVDQLAPHANGIADFVLSFALLLPPLLSYSVPLAFLMAMISSLEQMKQDREITAILAAGVRPISLLPPFQATAVLVFLVTLGINMILSPASYTTYNQRLVEMARNSILSDFKPGAFFKGIPGTVLLARDFDPATGKVKGLMMAKEREDGGSDIILANSGQVGPAGEGMVVSLEMGTLHPMNAHGVIYRSGSFEKLTSSVEVEHEEDSGVRSDQLLMAASIGELDNWIAEASAEGDRKRAASLVIEKHRRIALALTILLYPLLVFPAVLTTGTHGRALAFTASIGLFMLSFFLYSIGTRMGMSGIISPALGTYLPVLVLSALSLPVFLPFALGSRGVSR